MVFDGALREPEQGGGVFAQEAGGGLLSGRWLRAGRPEIVRETQSVVKRRVGVKPEDDEFWRIGVVEILFAEDLERAGRNLVGVGHEALDDFKTVNVGGVFLRAAEGVADGLAEKAHDMEKQEQHAQCGPIGGTLNPPRFAPPR